MAKRFKVRFENTDTGKGITPGMFFEVETEREALENAIDYVWGSKVENFNYVSGNPEQRKCVGYFVSDDYIILGEWEITITEIAERKIRQPDTNFFDPYEGYNYRSVGK